MKDENKTKAQLIQELEELRRQVAMSDRSGAHERQLRTAEDELQRYAERLNILHQIDRAILNAQSPEAIARVAMQHLRQLVPYARASILALDSRTKKVAVLAADVNGETTLGTGVQMKGVPSDSVLEEMATRGVWDVENSHQLVEPGRTESIPKAEGIRSHISVPLVAQGEIIGSLNLGAPEAGVFEPVHIEIAREVAGPLAVAIQNAKLYEAEQRARERAETLRHVVELLNASLSVDEVLQDLAEASARSLNADDCSILLLDPEGGDLVFRASTDIPRATIEAGLRVPAEGSIAGRVIREQNAQAVADVLADPDYYTKIANGTGTPLRSLLAVPLFRGEQVRGVVEALYAEPREFDTDEVQMLVAISNSAAAAMENAQLYESTQKLLMQRTAELNTIRQVAAAINQTLTLEAILNRGLREMIQASPADAGVIYVMDPERNPAEMLLKVEASMPPNFTGRYSALPLDEVMGFLGQHAEPGASPCSGGAPLSLGAEHLPAPLQTAGFHSALALALYVHDQCLGIIGLLADRPDAFSPSDQGFLHCIADQIAVAVENARLLAQARQDVQTRATLLHEVNHRVKNNLAAILGILSLEMNRSFPDQADYRAVLRDIQSRIQGLATVHDLLSATHWSPLPLEKLVGDVIGAVLGSSPLRQKVELVVNPAGTEQLLIAPKQAASLALIINELVTNSVKHAFRDRDRGRIEVSFYTNPVDQRTVVLELRDDGPGWPENVVQGMAEGVGLRLIRMTTRSPLRGRFSMHNDGGAVAILTFQLVLD